MNRHDLHPLQKQVLLSGLDDWIGLWEVAVLASERWPDLEPSARIDSVLRLVGELLELDLIRVGTLTVQGFVPSEAEPDDDLSRIRNEWMALKRDPHLGEIAWLDLTPGGEELAHRVSAEA